MRADVGGIEVTAFDSMRGAVEAVLADGGTVTPGCAVAINAEKVVRYRKDPELRASIDNATLRYADGMAVVLTLRKKGQRSAVRVAGCDLWEELMRKAAEHRIGVFLVGARPEVNALVATKLRDEMDATVVGTRDGFFEDDTEVVEEIRSSGARIVTVAMGSPRQENFIHLCREAVPDAFFMGVGGTYDIYAGTATRAPVWMREHGLEWLYRLARQPTRIGRQLNLVSYAGLHLTGRL